MKRAVYSAILIAGLFVSGTASFAHHSFAATYKEDEKEKIEGTVVQFLFRNPHSFLHVDAPDGKGVTRDSIKPGDHIIVVGQPGRNPDDHRLRLVSIERPADGWKWGGTFD